MVIWGALTMVTAAVHNPQGIMAIRFFLGLAESSTFVGTHYILGSWYTEKELGKRSGIFTASGLAGTMFGGFIQTGIQSSLDGARGLSGWRWLFIVRISRMPIKLNISDANELLDRWPYYHSNRHLRILTIPRYTHNNKSPILNL